nr:MAG TPA: hypothetical protein [Bacteriophage sp.]DAH37510.1 MAG TPA: hypothetical protein [Caudoviricetes sp.]
MKSGSLLVMITIRRSRDMLMQAYSHQSIGSMKCHHR